MQRRPNNNGSQARATELHAFSSLVSALKCQPGFESDDTKKRLLQQLKSTLHISNERYLAELRRFGAEYGGQTASPTKQPVREAQAGSINTTRHISPYCKQLADHICNRVRPALKLGNNEDEDNEDELSKMLDTVVSGECRERVYSPVFGGLKALDELTVKLTPNSSARTSPVCSENVAKVESNASNDKNSAESRQNDITEDGSSTTISDNASLVHAQRAASPIPLTDFLASSPRRQLTHRVSASIERHARKSPLPVAVAVPMSAMYGAVRKEQKRAYGAASPAPPPLVEMMPPPPPSPSSSVPQPMHVQLVKPGKKPLTATGHRRPAMLTSQAALSSGGVSPLYASASPFHPPPAKFQRRGSLSMGPAHQMPAASRQADVTGFEPGGALPFATPQSLSSLPGAPRVRGTPNSLGALPPFADRRMVGPVSGQRLRMIGLAQQLANAPARSPSRDLSRGGPPPPFLSAPGFKLNPQCSTSSAQIIRPVIAQTLPFSTQNYIQQTYSPHMFAAAATQAAPGGKRAADTPRHSTIKLAPTTTEGNAAKSPNSTNGLADEAAKFSTPPHFQSALASALAAAPSDTSDLIRTAVSRFDLLAGKSPESSSKASGSAASPSSTSFAASTLSTAMFTSQMLINSSAAASMINTSQIASFLPQLPPGMSFLGMPPPRGLMSRAIPIAQPPFSTGMMPTLRIRPPIVVPLSNTSSACLASSANLAPSASLASSASMASSASSSSAGLSLIGSGLRSIPQPAPKFGDTADPTQTTANGTVKPTKQPWTATILGLLDDIESRLPDDVASPHRADITPTRQAPTQAGEYKSLGDLHHELATLARAGSGKAAAPVPEWYRTYEALVNETIVGGSR